MLDGKMMSYKLSSEQKLHFCFISDDVYPLPAANGVCIMALAEQLRKMGHKVDIICNGHKNVYRAYCYGGIDVHSVKANYTAPYKYSFIRRAIRVFTLRLRLPIYPIKDPFRVRYYISCFNKINDEEKVDIIISSLMPVESVVAGISLKKQGCINELIIYQLDSISKNRNDQGPGKLQKYKRAKASEAEKSYFEYADEIFELICNEYYYSTSEFSKYQSKMHYLDIPIISEKLYHEIRDMECDRTIRNVITFTYAGVVRKDFRDPSLIMRLIAKLNKDICKCEFNFFTKREINEFLQELSPEDKMIFNYKGYVSQQELYKYYAHTDFLISIGNRSSGDIHEIPSKIFQYISTGKPIIHVSGGEFDSCIPYLKKYDNALVLNPEDSFNHIFEQLVCFVQQCKDSVVSLPDILENFKENTAEYSANIILNSIFNNI